MSGTLDLDFDRHHRTGFPEVVYGAGKTVDEVVAAATGLVGHHGQVLVTRCAAEALAALAAALPAGTVHARSRCFTVGTPAATAGPVGVVAAGTVDEPVAEEAELTMRQRGVRVERFRDCGVAGIHRLAKHLDAIRACEALVVIAGMEGALASVLGGLVDIPAIACPTSVGYGVATGGHAALNAMLASCTPGITVVNIDNGFGAGYAAATIALKLHAARQRPPAP